MRRFAVTAALLALGLTWMSPGASAHALLASSQPAAGTQLASPPTQVALTFTERPDLRLSSVHVLDQTGRAVERGEPQARPGDTRTLIVTVGELAKGVYTVTWRTTSSVDGHTTAGSFSFGVGVTPSPSASQQGVSRPHTPSPTPAAVLGRWCLYTGLALLFGAAIVGLFLARSVWPRPAVAGPAVIAALGLAIMVLDQRAVARVGLGTLLSSRTGRHLRVELVAMALVVLATALWAAVRSRVALAAVGITAVLTMLARADAGHAGASSAPWFTIGTQWVHFAAVGAWAGGLPYLLLALRRAAPEERHALARRFSTAATVGLGIVVLTGVVRAVNEVGAWSRFTSTSFGKALLVKLCVVALVIALAALNRWKLVPALGRDGASRGLRRSVGVEIAGFAGILVATALLTGLAPAASQARAKAAATSTSVTASGHDFATTTRVRLTISPGTVGPNRFDLRIADYDSGEPITANAVSLRFQFLDRANVPPSNLTLRRRATGRWSADGTNIALEGKWRATAVIERHDGGLEIPVTFTTRSTQKVSAQKTPGLPTIYTVTLADGRQVQVYLDPGRPGANELHATYLDPTGEELHITEFSVSGSGPGLTPGQSLTTRRLDELGHFVADVDARRGTYRFAFVADDHYENPIRVTLPIEVT